ncbi:hypothetical protein [Thiomonas intermedia]|nr:hypothetical protein [Thiomonas intermedia]
MFSKILIAHRGDQSRLCRDAAAKPNRLQARSAVAGDLAAAQCLEC